MSTQLKIRDGESGQVFNNLAVISYTVYIYYKLSSKFCQQDTTLTLNFTFCIHLDGDAEESISKSSVPHDLSLSLPSC